MTWRVFPWIFLPQQYYKTSLIGESLGQTKLNFHCHDCEGFKDPLSICRWCACNPFANAFKSWSPLGLILIPISQKTIKNTTMYNKFCQQNMVPTLCYLLFYFYPFCTMKAIMKPKKIFFQDCITFHTPTFRIKYCRARFESSWSSRLKCHTKRFSIYAYDDIDLGTSSNLFPFVCTITLLQQCPSYSWLNLEFEMKWITTWSGKWGVNLNLRLVTNWLTLWV